MSSVSEIDRKKEQHPNYDNEFRKHPLNKMKKELVHDFEKIEKRIFLSYQCGIYDHIEQPAEEDREWEMEESGREFNEIYCRYMLFKTKLKCKAYYNADDILNDAKKNLISLTQLRDIVACMSELDSEMGLEMEDDESKKEFADEVKSNFLKSEIAYTQLEAI